MSSAESIQDELRAALRWLIGTTIVLFLAVAALAGYVYVDATHKRQDLQRVASRTASALCTLRGDLEQRVRTSEEFLRDHPEGIPGISAATIRSGIANQQRTIEALSNLDCSPTTP